MSNLSDDKKNRLDELRRKKEEGAKSKNSSTTTTTTKTTVNSGSRLPDPGSSSNSSSSSSSTNPTPTPPSKADRKRLAQEALNKSSGNNSSNQQPKPQANTQANTQSNQRSTSNPVQSYQRSTSNQASKVNTPTRNTNTMSRQQQTPNTTDKEEEVIIIDTPQGLTEGVVSVLIYYLSTWAIWRPLRFLSARLTETIILYVLIPGFQGAFSGIVNPNPLPNSAPQVMKDAYNSTSFIPKVSGVVVPKVQQIITGTLNELDAQERKRLESQSQSQGKVNPFYPTPSPKSYEERVLEKLGQ